MKNLLRIALSLAALALAWSPVRAETPDPPPVVADEDARPDDGRHLIGLFDFVRPSKSTCPGGNCATAPSAVVVESAPVATASAGCACGESCPCGASTATRTERGPLFDRVRSWYPGKLIQTVRANRAAARGLCN